MAEFEIDIKGIEETQRKLYDFSDKLGDRITSLALRSAANFVLKPMRLAAPKRTGRLRRAIAVKNSRINNRRRNGRVGVYITIRQGKSRKDPKGAFYGRWVEHGYNRGSRAITGAQAVGLGLITRGQLNAKKASHSKYRGRNKQGIRYRTGGTHVPGRHFVRNTFNRLKRPAAELIVRNIEQAGKQLADKL